MPYFSRNNLSELQIMWDLGLETLTLFLHEYGDYYHNRIVIGNGIVQIEQLFVRDTEELMNQYRYRANTVTIIDMVKNNRIDIGTVFDFVSALDTGQMIEVE